MVETEGTAGRRGTGPTDAADYWDERHRTRDDLVSGGRIDLGRQGNAIFAALRVGQLLSLIGDLSSSTEPLFVLDAGCGKGTFARPLAECGHRVDGFDRSSAAIEYARRRGGPRYAVAELSAWTSPWLYDVVLAVDVMFHVIDDDAWRSGLRNLASLVRLSGSLIITERDAADRQVLGDYVIHRSRTEYEAVLNERGSWLGRVLPYGFRHSTVSFCAYTRIS